MRTISEKESIAVESKSDQKRLPDRDLVAAAICLANLEEEKRSRAPIPFEALMVLARLRTPQRLSIAYLAAVQQNEAATQKILKWLIEAGLIEGHDVKQDRAHALSAQVEPKYGL